MALTKKRPSDLESVKQESSYSSAKMSSPTDEAKRGDRRRSSQASSNLKQDLKLGDNSRVSDLILLTPYPVEPGHTLISIVRLKAAQWKPEMRSNAAHIAEGDNAGIIINKPASIMDFNKNQAGQKERQQPPSAKMSFKVFLINSETGKLTLEHRTLRFWLDHSVSLNNNGSGDEEDSKSAPCFMNFKQESSQLAQAYFCQLIGSKPNDDFPKNYVAFLMKLMRLLKSSSFSRITKMEVELRQLAHEDHTKPPSRACKYELQLPAYTSTSNPLA